MRLTILLILLMLAASAGAKNVDLSTVPDRDSVQLTIYNSEDLTLVRETRKVTFKKGANPLQFSWANTLIDPTSVQLTFRTQSDKLEVLDTTYPRDKQHMLYWNVKSDFDGEAAIEISYFTSGITWSADYQVITNRGEDKASVQGFVRVSNQSGEAYENAQVRLVVGTINLVEKITQLANISRDEFDDRDGDAQRGLKMDALKKVEEQFEAKSRPTSQPLPMPVTKPKQVVKEGLSEYFIYTIEGTETIPHGWSKRLRSMEAGEVPVKIQYRYRPQEYGDQLVRMYLMTNNVESKLGTTPLPDGVVRVFRDNGRDGLSYLAAQTVKYIPIGDKFELNLGPDPEVVFELIKLKTWRENIWMKVGAADVFRQVGGAVQIGINSSVAGWDEHQLFTQRIRNYTAKPIDVEIRRSYDGHVLFRSELKPTLHDFRTVQFGTTIDAGKRADLLFDLVTLNGRNAKQNNVTLETAEVKP